MIKLLINKLRLRFPADSAKVISASLRYEVQLRIWDRVWIQTESQAISQVLTELRNAVE